MTDSARAEARAAAISALRDLADDLETTSHAAQSAGERQGLLTAARFARAKANAMEANRR